MSKTPSSKLYDLVNSLLGSEKRYFKLFVKNKDSGHSKYAQLFDAIDVQEVFNDEELQLAVYGKEPVETRKYSELKAYLYDLILKSLQAYDEKSSVDYRLKNMLLGVRTLFKRSHFDDCKDLLRKAKKLATNFEDFNTLVEILDWEKKIAYAQMDINFLDRELGRINAEERKCLEQLNNVSAYRSIFFKVLMSIRKGVSPAQAGGEEAVSLMENSLVADEKNALSHKAKVLFYRIRSIYFLTVADWESSYWTSKKLVELLESRPDLLKEDVSEYISALNNLTISCGRLSKYAEVDENLAKMLTIKPITVDDAVKVTRQYYNIKFRVCTGSGEFEEGKRELTRHLREVSKFDPKLFQKSDFYFQYFYIYFGNNDFQKALNSLNDWLSHSGGVERKDLESLARILNLIIHYELGNTMLLDSLLRSTYRFLNKEDRLSLWEKKFMAFIREAGKPHSKREMKKALENLKQDFEDLSRSPSYGIFKIFDVGAWLESKISGKAFSEVVREKYQEVLRQKSNPEA